MRYFTPNPTALPIDQIEDAIAFARQERQYERLVRSRA